MAEPAVGFGPVDRALHEVLVVNDDPVSRYTTVRWLQSAGFRTREAATGADGLRLADASVAAMVLDINLPDIDGFELCRIVRSQPATARLPVLHLSAAYVSDEDKVKGLDAGADAYLTHPVDPAVLVASVQSLVRARAAEDAMRRSESQFRAIYARAPGGICLLDRDGRLVDANPALLNLLGRSLEEVAGRALSAFVPDDAVERAEAFARATHAGESRDEFPVVGGDGRPLQVQWTMLPEIQPGLNLALAADVSQREALEAQRQQALQREREARNAAERLGRMKDEFIAVLSHELRSPLTAINGWVHILRSRDDAELRRRGLEAIDRNVRLQSRLVSDLLDMSSINLGKMRLTLEDVDVGQVVGAAVAALAPAIAEKGVEVAVRADPDLPTVRADGSRLQQIASNLLGNAVKFSVRGGRVGVDLAARGDGVVMAFSDAGKGIAPDFLPLLFDRFSQADAGSNRRHGGLGLGLSIVRHLVESHGGTVSVESPGLGQGATFSVWLPSSGPSGDAIVAPADAGADATAPDPESTLAGVRLLVVDDDPDICAMLQIILGDRGAEVLIAHDVATALQSVAQYRPHVLLSDVGMPGRDGYALIREVRRREGGRGHLPAVALTSYTRDQDRDQALREGFDTHCPKPVRPLQLVTEIRRLLDARPAVPTPPAPDAR